MHNVDCLIFNSFMISAQLNMKPRVNLSNEDGPPCRTSDLPLVVDLDGTLTPTDTLFESLIMFIKRFPLMALLLPFWLMRGRAVMKSRIAHYVQPRVSSLPLRQDVVDFLVAEKARGRTLVLATAAHHSIADAVAARLGIFDAVLATTDRVNLKGKRKLAALQQHYPQGFVYAGDCSADLPIWAAAQGVILVGVPAGVGKRVRNKHAVEREFFASRRGLVTWLKALRVHQWAKNLLLLAPLLTGFVFLESGWMVPMILAVGSFCLAASATYLVNDLWDLDSDRAHPRKCKRPFAAASIGIAQGLVVAALLLLSAFVMAALVSASFAGMLALYLVLTSAYSWSLKRYVLIDVIMLSVLYTLRIVAGAVALDRAVSSWLLAFSVFVFLGLALVKRCSELVSMQKLNLHAAHGRDYRIADLVVLWPFGCATSVAAVVVFGLFISAPETVARYGSPELLWLSALGLVYWQARMWIKTSRGEMHDDPLVFTIRDQGSRITVLLIVASLLAAHLIP